MKIQTPEEHEAFLKVVYFFMDAVTTKDELVLSVLAEMVEKYEEIHFPVNTPKDSE